MKAIVSTFLLCLLGGIAGAQTFSGGLRAGVSSWITLNDHLHGEFKSATFTKEAFVRGEGFGKWAFELSISQDHYENDNLFSRYIYIEYFEPGSLNHFLKTDGIDRTVYQLHLKGAYELSCNKMEQCTWMKRFKDYIGIVASPTFVDQKQLEFIEPDNGDDLVRTMSQSRFELWAGLSNTLVFSLSDKWAVSGNMSFEVNTLQGYDLLRIFNENRFYYPNARFSGTLGIGYKF